MLDRLQGRRFIQEEASKVNHEPRNGRGIREESLSTTCLGHVMILSFQTFTYLCWRKSQSMEGKEEERGSVGNLCQTWKARDLSPVDRGNNWSREVRASL